MADAIEVAAYAESITKVMLAERERCAKIADVLAQANLAARTEVEKHGLPVDPQPFLDKASAAAEIATAIRSGK